MVCATIRSCVDKSATKKTFPSEISDDPLLEMVLAEPDNYPHAEERRLFYVALTRTKNEVVLMISPDESLFVSELIKDNNEIVERLKSFLEKMSKEKRVNWQMLACYLDGKIFEFIQANKDNEVVMKFATELVEELAEQFNLTRNV